MEIDGHRILSGLVALVLLGFAYWSGEPGAVALAMFVLVWPLAIIWYAEAIGSMTNASRSMRATPGWLVRAFGWLVLVAVIAWYLGTGRWMLSLSGALD